jgi:hypothetical protein
MGLPDSAVAQRLAVPAGADQRAVASYPRREDCTGFGPMNATAGNSGRGAAAAHAVDLAKTYRALAASWPARRAAQLGVLAAIAVQ